ncbi:RWD-domain-containing protein [Tothia fuscella]|uniref:RWD-domain-containing protein n=1 Tax=Tothia fuscella TaxID=1048955 RepID=A0A9P4NT23_9PEZI|nr:RWD-domain-containing protein [Tothia fuscella]
MGIDEQKEEREVLDSIFPEEITDISETEYQIAIRLDVPNIDEEDDIEPPTIILRVEYPSRYPDEAPRLDLIPPPNAPKYEHFDIQNDKANLLQSLEPIIEENLGMAMVFTLVSTVKDGAELLISERQKATQAVKEVEAAKVEEEENRKFHGTPVTRENFLNWSRKFKEEMIEDEKRRKEEQEAEDKKRRVAKEEIRMTGRQLWEKGLVGKIEEDDGEDGLDGMMEKATIEA